MTYAQIVEMYWDRNEQAISVTSEKYGTYCYSVAYGILHNEEDSKESVNDTTPTPPTATLFRIFKKEKCPRDQG